MNIKDINGIPRYAHCRGTADKFRMDVAGSDKSYGFCYRGKGKELFVFEAPIDLLSHIALYPAGWKERSYLSLGGVSPKALERFLSERKDIESVFIATDNDEAGNNDYLPHNYNNNCVVYTGTHDNETLAGWFAGLSKEQKERVRTYLGDFDTANKWMYKKLIQHAMMSAADTCIIPIQDWLGLDNSGRMNTPGTVDANWSWRLLPNQIPEELGEQMLTITKRYGRANWDALNRLETETAEEETEEE